MRIKIGYELSFSVASPTPVMLALFTHPSRVNDLEQPEFLSVSPEVPVYTFIDCFGNKLGRVMMPPGQFVLRYDNVCRDSGMPDEFNWNAEQHALNDLPPETLQFLLGSRYCEVERFLDMGWELFGRTPPGWPRVQAVIDWAHNHIKFGYAYARSTKTAWEALQERHGVCRDFQHLSIAMLRALNIPARYATGYLGDIGVPISPAPMDFSAWLEVYLGGRWWTMDARHNKPRIGRVLMARGRDAVDVALTTSFGPASLTSFQVFTEELF
jgi:transglutaminase-like putative cysteine protease